MIVFSDEKFNTFSSLVADWWTPFRWIAIALFWCVDKIAFLAVTAWNAIFDIGEGFVTFITGTEGDDLYQRMDANWYRTGTVVVVGLIVGTTLFHVIRIKKPDKQQLDKRLAIVLAAGYGFGSILVVWEIFNYFTPPAVPLFPSIPSPGEVFDAALKTGLITVIAAIAACWIAYKLMRKFTINLEPKTSSIFGSLESLIRKVLNLVLKGVVAAGVWIFLMMIVLLVTANGLQTLAQFN